MTFTVNSKYGALNPNTLNRLRFVIVGPNDDYSDYSREESVGSAVQNGDFWE